MDSFFHRYTCRVCGGGTNTRDAFGDPICHPCWEAEDEAVEAYERAQAKRFGYSFGFKSEPKAAAD